MIYLQKYRMGNKLKGILVSEAPEATLANTNQLDQLYQITQPEIKCSIDSC